MICYYWFFNHGFEFQASVCNGCHDLTMLSVNTILLLSQLKMWVIVVLFITLANQAINLLKNSVLEDRWYIHIKKYCFRFQSIQDSFFV